MKIINNISIDFMCESVHLRRVNTFLRVIEYLKTVETACC